MKIEIELAEHDEARLREAAAVSGYVSVEKFAVDHLLALLEEQYPTDLAPLTEEELQASLAMLDQSMAEIDAGLGIPLEEARERALKSLRELAG